MTFIEQSPTDDIAERHVNRTAASIAQETWVQWKTWAGLAAFATAVLFGLTVFAYVATPEQKEAFQTAFTWANNLRYLVDGLASSFKTVSEGASNFAYAIALIIFALSMFLVSASASWLLVFGVKFATGGEVSEQVRLRISRLGPPTANNVESYRGNTPWPGVPDFLAHRLSLDSSKRLNEALNAMADHAMGNPEKLRKIERIAKTASTYSTQGAYEALLDDVSKCELEGADELGLELTQLPPRQGPATAPLPGFANTRDSYRTLLLRYKMNPTFDACERYLVRSLHFAQGYDEIAVANMLIGHEYATRSQGVQDAAAAAKMRGKAKAAFVQVKQAVAEFSSVDRDGLRPLIDQLYASAMTAKLHLMDQEYAESLEACKEALVPLSTSYLDGAGAIAESLLETLRTLRGKLNLQHTDSIVGHAETVLAILRSAGGRSDFSTTDDERNRLSFRANFDLGNAISSGTGTQRDPRRGLVKYERALAIGRDHARSDGPISHDDLSDLYERMAIAARDSFAYWDAKDWLINAIDERMRGSGNGAQLAQLYFELSAIQEELNDPSAAESVRAAQNIVASAGQRGGSPPMPLKRNGAWLGHYRLGQLAMRPSSKNLAAAHLHFEAALKAATVLYDFNAKEFVPTLQLCLSWLGLGSCYLNGNRYRDARTALDKAVTFGRAALKFGSDPDCAHAVWDAELKLAQASLALEQIDTAAEHLQRADSALGLLDESQSDLPKIQTMLHHGDHFAARGKMDEAISCYASCIDGARALFDERQNPHGWPVMADAAERIGATARQMREFHLRARNQVDPKVATGKALMDPSSPQTSATAAAPPAAAAGNAKLHAIRGGRAGTQTP